MLTEESHTERGMGKCRSSIEAKKNSVGMLLGSPEFPGLASGWSCGCSFGDPLDVWSVRSCNLSHELPLNVQGGFLAVWVSPLGKGKLEDAVKIEGQRMPRPTAQDGQTSQACGKGMESSGANSTDGCIKNHGQSGLAQVVYAGGESSS